MLLQELQRSPALDLSQKKWLREELMRTRKGIQGERELAHYLDHYFKDAENHVLLHDLRFVVEGEVTQIDYLIFNRSGSVYLLETKNYACNLVINDRGEFTAEYENARFGIPSPIEQSLRHEKALRKLLEDLDIVGRTQKHPDFYHVVMLHPKATIERPPVKSFDTTNVIKADQFPTWHKRFVDKIGIGMLFKSAMNMRSLETTTEWGEKLQKAAPPGRLAGAARLHAATGIEQSSRASDGVFAARPKVHRACACQLVRPCASTACCDRVTRRAGG